MLKILEKSLKIIKNLIILIIIVYLLLVNT